MSRPVSRATIIGAIVRKDLAEYGRDRLWAFLTVLVLIITVGLYWVLPDTVNESIRVGVSGIDDSSALAGLDAETGVVMLLYLDIAYERWKQTGKMATYADLGIEPVLPG